MKDKPLFKDYLRRIIRYIFKAPALSGEKLYTLLEFRLVLCGQGVLILALYAAFCYSPYSHGWYEWQAVTVTVLIGVLLSGLYWVFFVYRFAHFKARWARPEEHEGEVPAEWHDASGNFYYTKENKKAVWKSRGMFFALMAVIAAATVAYGIFGFGMAYLRIYNSHRQELLRLEGIYREYDHLQAYYWPWENGNHQPHCYGDKHGDDPDKMSIEDRMEITGIIQRLRNDYVSYIGIDYTVPKYLSIGLSSKAQYYHMVYYPMKVSAKTISEDIETLEPKKKIIPIDGHWWAVFGYEDIFSPG